MGDVAHKHIVVTGAAGFLGRAIVRTALDQGHEVTALVRRTPDDALACRTLTCDLAACDSAELAAQIGPADAVIAAAGEMSSDFALHQASTLPATRTACDVARQCNAHMVLASSISIYDFRAMTEGTFVTEDSPLEHRPQDRDGYVTAKLAQETMVHDLCPSASVLRFGALFGPGRAWNAHLGIGLGPVLLRLASRGQIPLCQIDRAAQATLNAATHAKPGAVNILDEDLPDRIRFLHAFSNSGWPRIIVPLPWQVFNALAPVLGHLPRAPGLLRRGVLHARMKPLGYDPSRCAAHLGPLPNRSFESAMKEALDDA